GRAGCRGVRLRQPARGRRPRRHPARPRQRGAAPAAGLGTVRQARLAQPPAGLRADRRAGGPGGRRAAPALPRGLCRAVRRTARRGRTGRRVPRRAGRPGGRLPSRCHRRGAGRAAVAAGAGRPRSRPTHSAAGPGLRQPRHFLPARRRRRGAPPMKPSLHAETHEVFNQVPSLDGANLYRLDLPLQEWIRRYHGDWVEERLNAYGALAGGPLMQAGFLANENRPVFKTHDRYGNRVDLVEFHPAYHELMRTAVEHGLPSLPWVDPRAGAHVARAGLTYLHSQAEAATGCPLTMTFAAVPALRLQPDIAEVWLPKILASEYDPRNVGIEQKAGVTIGMAMTEKQGGTDVRANTTRAYPVGLGGPGQAYELVGHKWFCSAPMCDAFLTLAYTDKGLSCFLLPRHRPDGTRNQFYVQRLKNKLGNWANASSEVEYRGALAWMIGEE